MRVILVYICFLSLIFQWDAVALAREPVDYVDPFIGTGNQVNHLQ